MQFFLKSALGVSALAFAAVVAAPANAVSVVNFDVAGIASNDGFGSPINEVRTINIGAFSRVIGVGWNVTLTTVSPSWFEEFVVTFTDSAFTNGVDLVPAVDDSFGGVGNYDSGGILSLTDLGLDFAVGADGVLRLEFWENFDDFAGATDGFWTSGTLSFQYEPAQAVIPEPATWGMMIAGFGLVGFAARRRRMVPLAQ